MATVKISGLPVASAVVDANEFEINEAGTSKKVTGSQISAYVQSQLSVDLTTDITGTLPTANGGTGLTSPGTAGNLLTSNGTTWTSAAPQGVPTGTILDFGGTSAPSGYLLCDGSNVNRTTEASLFAVIGTAFGAGDGSTTFGVPDFRRRVAVGSGGTGSATLGNALGNSGGAETHTLTTDEMPSHIHGTTLDRRWGSGNGSGQGWCNDGQVAGSSTRDTNSTGSGNAHNILQPSIVVTKIIKT